MTKSPVKRAFFILFIVAAVVAVLLMLAQDQVTLKVRSAVGAQEPRHAAYLAGLTGSDLTHGNEFDVLDNGDEIFPAMLDAVKGAKRRISLETYIYEDGQVAGSTSSSTPSAAAG